jgi:hypothetical protein
MVGRGVNSRYFGDRVLCRTGSGKPVCSEMELVKVLSARDEETSLK